MRNPPQLTTKFDRFSQQTVRTATLRLGKDFIFIHSLK